MPEITQKNVRLLLPGKIARAVAMLARERRCSEKEALLEFYRSDLYLELEHEESKRWWASPLQLFQAIMAESEDKSRGAADITESFRPLIRG